MRKPVSGSRRRWRHCSVMGMKPAEPSVRRAARVTSMARMSLGVSLGWIWRAAAGSRRARMR